MIWDLLALLTIVVFWCVVSMLCGWCLSTLEMFVAGFFSMFLYRTSARRI